MGTPPNRAVRNGHAVCVLPCPQTASQRAINNLPVAYLRLLAAARFDPQRLAHLT
jgi:hypothetical protein